MRKMLAKNIVERMDKKRAFILFMALLLLLLAFLSHYVPKKLSIL
jgi:hypothetical protein